MSQNIATVTSDSDILASISAHGTEAGFDELPVAFNQVKPSAIHGIRIDFASPAAGVMFEQKRAGMSNSAWGDVMLDALDHAGIEDIEWDNHHSVTAWMDKDGVWHETLEGNYLASMI